MPPELRKRKAPVSEPVAAPPAKKKGPVAKAVAKVKEAVSPKAAKTNGAASASKVAVGDTITLEGFGGEIETNEGVKTTLKALVDESEAGVVLFTYPKASTPGCTTQVCLFRDQYKPLTATGFSIYGLSKDSPKANTTFKTKQNLPYPLLCDTSSTLIKAIGLTKAPASTARGVFVVDKSAKVIAVETGGPAATVEVVKKLVASGDVTAAPAATSVVAEPKAEASANGVSNAPMDPESTTAAEVAGTAEKLDSNGAEPTAT
ncbi:merozoite capping protein-1 [Drepanopeziza brunnea f. sp. 'multigermtubi' MB_m1]|uniref:thioredoxin-dependent peroxiredoxin n=1 Tax=Marssonina brunnea f. sp. multigermtubi (strain MB_m1) TaxID=1072389 RepID=K1WW25_MARBU|nr:merozoite capping protein-1 [Drepanopeziza brunnea f. sp. 'multigermtubi' MB_m1]EKD16637.1 merozoite capping protein-1 [Drepanopeziza brunnea f. sp. 'multigermtubi' MB_m1]